MFLHSLRRPHRLFGAAAIAATAALLAACSSSPSASSDSKSGSSSGDKLKPTTVNVAVLPTANMAPLYIGQKQGFFKDENITLKITTVGGGADEIAGLQSGSFDFIAVGYVPLFAAAAQGLPVALISGNDAGGSNKDNDWQVLVAGKNSNISSLKDLESKTIGVNALKGVAEATIRASLKDQGVDDSKVKFVEVPFPQVPAAVDKGTIAAGFGTEPFVTQTLEQGGSIIDYPSLTLGTNFPNGAWATSTKVVQSNAAEVKAFKRAMDKSIAYAQKNEQAVRDIIPTYTTIKPDLAAKIRIPYFTSDLDTKALTKLDDISVEFGAVSKKVDLDKLIVKP